MAAPLLQTLLGFLLLISVHSRGRNGNPCTPDMLQKGYYHHLYPGDPQKYIQCTEWGKAYVVRCGTQEVWDQYYGTCVDSGIYDFQQAPSSNGNGYSNGNSNGNSPQPTRNDYPPPEVEEQQGVQQEVQVSSSHRASFSQKSHTYKSTKSSQKSSQQKSGYRQSSKSGYRQNSKSGYQQNRKSGYQQNSKSGYQQPRKSYQQPQKSVNQQPTKSVNQQPSGKSGYQQPRKSVSPQPAQKSGYQQPTKSYQQPQKSGYQQPRKSGYQQNKKSVQQPPQKSGYQQKSSSQQPQKSGYQQKSSYQPPQKSGYQQKSSGQPPQKSGYSQKSSNQQPKKSGYQQPSQKSGYQQKSSYKSHTKSSYKSNQQNQKSTQQYSKSSNQQNGQSNNNNKDALNPCTHPNLQYIPHPTDRQLYFECVDGQLMNRQCSENYVWVAPYRRCDPIELRQRPQSPCEVSTDMLHPYPGDPTKYTECKDSRTAIVHQCPTDHLWDQEQQKCFTNATQEPSVVDFSDLEAPTDQGGDDETEANIKRLCIQKNSFYHPYPHDDRKFIQCDEYGNMYVRRCGPNKIWEDEVKTCVGRLNMTRHNLTTNGYQAKTGDDTATVHCAPGAVWNAVTQTCMTTDPNAESSNQQPETTNGGNGYYENNGGNGNYRNGNYGSNGNQDYNGENGKNGGNGNYGTNGDNGNQGYNGNSDTEYDSATAGEEITNGNSNGKVNSNKNCGRDEVWNAATQRCMQLGDVFGSNPGNSRGARTSRSVPVSFYYPSDYCNQNEVWDSHIRMCVIDHNSFSASLGNGGRISYTGTFKIQVSNGKSEQGEQPMGGNGMGNGFDYGIGNGEAPLQPPFYDGPNPCGVLLGNYTGTNYSKDHPVIAAELDYYFPFPMDPTWFIQCDHLGEMYIMPCGPGKVWNQQAKVCVSQVNRGYNTDPWNETPSNGQETIETKSEEDKQESNEEVGQEEPQTNPCEGSNEIYHIHPKSATSFIMCIHGSPYVMPCPDQSKWRNDILTCVFPIDL